MTTQYGYFLIPTSIDDYSRVKKWKCTEATLHLSSQNMMHKLRSMHHAVTISHTSWAWHATLETENENEGATLAPAESKYDSSVAIHASCCDNFAHLLSIDFSSQKMRTKEQPLALLSQNMIHQLRSMASCCDSFCTPLEHWHVNLRVNKWGPKGATFGTS